MREHDTPLIEAARHGCAVDVAALLGGGADFEEPKTNGSGATPLSIACLERATPRWSLCCWVRRAGWTRCEQPWLHAALHDLPRWQGRGGQRAAGRGRGSGYGGQRGRKAKRRCSSAAHSLLSGPYRGDHRAAGRGRSGGYLRRTAMAPRRCSWPANVATPRSPPCSCHRAASRPCQASDPGLQNT